MMDKSRYGFGLLPGFVEVCLLFFVIVVPLQQFGDNGILSLPLDVSTIITDVVMLGIGFCVIATAAATLDDPKYECLTAADNISKVNKDTAQSSSESLDAKQWSDIPAGSSSEQRDAHEI